MKKLLVKLLAFFRSIRLWQLKMRGKTMDDVHAERMVNGQAWGEFCDTLKAAGGNLLYGNSPKDPFNQAEGHRYLSRLVRAGLEAFVEYNDPEFPVLKRLVHETVKLGADNPDNYYQNAQISGAYEYRVTGHRGTIAHIGFYTQNGSYGSTGGLAPCDALMVQDMFFEKDGTFELILSREKKGQNWLKIEDETTLFMVRQEFGNRDKERVATMHIECIGGPSAPRLVTPKMIDEGLNTASTFVAGASFLFAKWANSFQKHPNLLPQFDPKVSNAAGGDKNIAYYHSYWQLKEDEALVIEAMPPTCRNWNFQVNNYWMESLDYRFHRIHINKQTAAYEADGSIKIILAHQKPKHPNWLTTDGHLQGTMCFRWYHAEHAPVPACRVVKFADL